MRQLVKDNFTQTMVGVFPHQDNIVGVVGGVSAVDAGVGALRGEHSAPFLDFSEGILGALAMLQNMIKVTVT
jgi:hypothetical protein